MECDGSRIRHVSGMPDSTRVVSNRTLGASDRRRFRRPRTIARITVIAGVLTIPATVMWGQQVTASQAPLPDAPSVTLARLQIQTQQDDSRAQAQEPNPNPGQSATPQQDSPETPGQKKQPKRILYVIPNYRAVSSDANLPPLTPKGKFKLMIDDSFDYSAFLYTGFVAGLRCGIDSYPELGRGWSGYGRYYWRFFVDQADGNAFTEFLLPVAFQTRSSLLHQRPRKFFASCGVCGKSSGGHAQR